MCPCRCGLGTHHINVLDIRCEHLASRTLPLRLTGNDGPAVVMLWAQHSCSTCPSCKCHFEDFPDCCTHVTAAAMVLSLSPAMQQLTAAACHPAGRTLAAPLASMLQHGCNTLIHLTRHPPGHG